MNEGNFYEQLSNEICITHKPGIVTSILHKSLEKGNEALKFSKVLEIGGNIGEHIPFVEHSFDHYIVSDIRFIPENERIQSIERNQSKVTFVVADCQELPFEKEQFDRIVVTCVLHHIANLETTLRELSRVLKGGGQLDILLPCDPGMFYRFSRQVSSLRKARKLKKYNEAKLFHAIEHRNHFESILILIKNEFIKSKIKLTYWPFKFHSWNLEVFCAIRVVK